MRALALLALLALTLAAAAQQPSAPAKLPSARTATPLAPAGAAQSAAAPPAPEPFELPDPWELCAEVQRLSIDGLHERARAKAGELALVLEMRESAARGELDSTREGLLAGVEEAQRAELRSGFDELGRSLAALDDAFAAEARYAQGLALLRADDALDLRESAAAADAFARAAALAGPGELRLDALYDAGVARLLEGERRYREIPEVSGAAAAPPQPGAPLAPGEEPPDPLPIARGHYMDARARLIERLRADWRDADTRANLELVQRRLAELDMIERQREEDEQEQEQPSDQQQPDEDSQDESEQRDQGDEQQDQQQEPSPEDAEPKDSDSEEQQQEQEEPEEPPPGEPESEDEAGEDDSETEPPPPAQPLDEQMLTQEEVQRLMDRLQQIEQANEKLQELIRQAQRGVVKVEKDW